MKNTGRKRYHYAVMNFVVLLGMCRVPIKEDAFLADDDESLALTELISKGYRWVRTDGEWAIFEKELGGE